LLEVDIYFCGTFYMFINPLVSVSTCLFVCLLRGG
jgi:hypothetical protein